MPGLLPAHAKENDDGQGNHHHFLITFGRVWINTQGQKLPTDEFGTGLIEKLVSPRRTTPSMSSELFHHWRRAGA